MDNQVDSLHKLSEKLFRLNFKVNEYLKETEKKIEKIKNKYEPRNQFNSWRNSQEGKQWKEEQYRRQNKRCPICQQPILSLKGSHIDHIKPLSTHPHLALNTKNMRITHGACNILRINETKN